MIDVDSLLDPISEDSPAGVDLRWVDGDTTFHTIEDNRNIVKKCHETGKFVQSRAA